MKDRYHQLLYVCTVWVSFRSVANALPPHFPLYVLLGCGAHAVGRLPGHFFLKPSTLNKGAAISVHESFESMCKVS